MVEISVNLTAKTSIIKIKTLLKHLKTHASFSRSCPRILREFQDFPQESKIPGFPRKHRNPASTTSTQDINKNPYKFLLKKYPVFYQSPHF